MPKLDHTIKAIKVTEDDYKALQAILDTIDTRKEILDLILLTDTELRDKSTRGRPSSEHQYYSDVNRFIYRAGLKFVLEKLINADPSKIPSVDLPEHSSRPHLREQIIKTLKSNYPNHNPTVADALANPYLREIIADNWLYTLLLINRDADSAVDSFADDLLNQLTQDHYTKDEADEEYSLRSVIHNLQSDPDHINQCEQDEADYIAFINDFELQPKDMQESPNPDDSDDS